MSNFNDKEITQLLKRANISESVREGFMARRRTLLKEAEDNKAYMEEMEEEGVYEANCADDDLDEAVESLEEELDMLAQMEYDDDEDLMSEQEDDDEGLDLDAEPDDSMDDPMDDSEMDLPDEDKADAEINVPEDLARSVIELADMLKGAMNLDDAPAEDMPGDEDDMGMDMPEDDMGTGMPEDEDEEAQLQEMVSRIVNRVAQRLIKESKKA
jgi:hypothetical protein